MYRYMLGKSRCFVQVIWMVGTLLLAVSAPAGSNDEQVAREVAGLLEYITTSGCQFYRNGSWFDGGEAAGHIRRKYEYARERGKVKSADDFIAFAATKSSISGQPYQVRCSDGRLRESAEWLKAELSRLRSGRAAAE